MSQIFLDKHAPDRYWLLSLEPEPPRISDSQWRIQGGCMGCYCTPLQSINAASLLHWHDAAA
jgi:hypothetical protein